MKDLHYYELLRSYSNTVCGLAHRFMYSHISAKSYVNYEEMRHWHEGRRDACRSELKAIMHRLRGDDKKFVLDEVRETIAYCKRSLASTTTVSAK